jgi:hypothetical protein
MEQSRKIPVTTETPLKVKILELMKERKCSPHLQDHNNKRISWKRMAVGTLERYTTLKHVPLSSCNEIQGFDIAIKIDHAFITDYEFKLRS